MKEYDIIIAIDPGLTGAIAIFEGDNEPKIHPIPLKTIIRNKKNKKIYNYEEIVNILKPYKGKLVYYGLEVQGVRPGEGGVSAMTNGTGYGFLQGVGYAMEFDVNLIHPKTWKKIYPEMITEEAKKMIEEKKIKTKTKKEKDKLTRLIKASAKAQARKISTDMYPTLAKEFIRVKDDGKADAVLIGNFIIKGNV